MSRILSVVPVVSVVSVVSVGLLVWCISGPPAAAAEPPHAPGNAARLPWCGDYAAAMETARREGRMMFVYFCAAGEDPLCEEFESKTLSDPAVVERLSHAVLARVVADTTIRVQGKEVVLLNHSAFAALEGRPGVAIVDFVHCDARRYGAVVSTFPFTKGRPYTARQLAVLSDRPSKAPLEKKDPLPEGPSHQAQAPAGATGGSEQLPWHTDYAEATGAAQRERKMMFIYFHDPGTSEPCARFASEALSDPEVVERLEQVVRLKLPLDAAIRMNGEETALLEQPAFAEMLGEPGVAIIDFAHEDAECYGQVVSTFPFLNGRPYTPGQLAVILDLPPGTLTQRTLIYAVRTHPDGPASTECRLDPYLLKEASLHSQHQARICRQGHHNWSRRFHRINAKLRQGLLACEVCAESWPGQNLVEAAIDCVHSWRQSSGHWGAVRARHRVYGYDMKRGSNGIWYATGIFGRRS